jgi:flagellar motor switch protein FliM
MWPCRTRAGSCRRSRVDRRSGGWRRRAGADRAVPWHIDALVEVQTTGRVDPRELPPRPVTRIDEALCRDFIDLGLAAFSRETREVEDRDWPDRLSFGSRIADPGQLGLLLPDRAYHALSADVALGVEGARRGQVALILPRTRDPVPRAIAATGTADPEAWRKALEQAVAEACVELDAVLVRTTRSLRDLEAMGPGDLIGFDAADLAQVRLETSSGTVVAHGRLGQIGGQRALRMATGQPGAGAGPGSAPDLPTGIAAMPPLPPDDMAPPLPDPMAVAAPPPDPDMPPPDPADAPPPDFAPEAAPLDFTPQTAPLDPDALPP